MARKKKKVIESVNDVVERDETEEMVREWLSNKKSILHNQYLVVMKFCIDNQIDIVLRKDLEKFKGPTIEDVLVNILRNSRG